MPANTPPIAHHRAPFATGLARGCVVFVATLALQSSSPAFATSAQTIPDAAPRVSSAHAPNDWAWPLAPPITLMRPFVAPATPYSAGHRGLDIAAQPGDGIVAAAEGVVFFAGSVAGRSTITLDHGNGVRSSIEPVDASVEVGDHVRAGEAIGTISTGGHCDAVCVHFGVRIDDAYVSPFIFLGGMPRSVLLPLG